MINKWSFKEGFLYKNYPLLAEQLDEEKSQINVEEIYIKTFYDSRRLPWKCHNCNHEWHTSLESRFKNSMAWRQGKCGQCIKGISFPEVAIRVHFEKMAQQIFPEAVVTSAVYNSYELDIVVKIPNLTKVFAIEYDSEYFHKDRIKQDKLKNKGVADKYFLIRVREDGLTSLDDPNVMEITSPRIPRNDISLFDVAVKGCFQYFLEFLKKHSGYNVKKYKEITGEVSKFIEQLNTRTIEKEIVERLSDVPIEKQLSTVAPPLAEQYSSKNSVGIDKVNAYSNESRLWECPIDETHRLEPYWAVVNAKTREYKKALQNGYEYNRCPYCSGVLAIQSKSAKAMYPEVIAYLEYGISQEQGGEEIDFSSIPTGSTRKFPFACADCGFIQDKHKLKTLQSLIRISENIKNGTSKYSSLCPQCHDNNLLEEGRKYSNIVNSGKTVSNVAYTHNTSIKRVKKLISEYEEMRRDHG